MAEANAVSCLPKPCIAMSQYKKFKALCTCRWQCSGLARSSCRRLAAASAAWKARLRQPLVEVPRGNVSQTMRCLSLAPPENWGGSSSRR